MLADVRVDDGVYSVRPRHRDGRSERVSVGPFARAPGLVLGTEFAAREPPAGDRRPRRRRRRDAPAIVAGWFGPQRPGQQALDCNGFWVGARSGEDLQALPVAFGIPLSPWRLEASDRFFGVVVLRHRGAAYYSGRAPGAGDRGVLDIVGLDTTSRVAPVFAVAAHAHRRTPPARLVEMRVARWPAMSAWFGAACLADDLAGRNRLELTSAERGGHWRGDGFQRCADGVRSGPGGALAELPAPGPMAIVNVEVTAGSSGRAGALIRDADGVATRVLVGCRDLVVTRAGTEQAVGRHRGRPWTPMSLQLDLSARGLAIRVDGRQVLAGHPALRQIATPPATVGVAATASFTGVLRAFEGHRDVLRAPDWLWSRAARSQRSARQA